MVDSVQRFSPPRNAVAAVMHTTDVDGYSRPVSGTTPFPVAQAGDQDPIFDHANGTKTSVTASATIITPPAGCKYLRISTDVNIFVTTDGGTAVDDGKSILVIASQPEIVPVTAGTTVKALSSSGTATVRCTPLKLR